MPVTLSTDYGSARELFFSLFVVRLQCPEYGLLPIDEGRLFFVVGLTTSYDYVYSLLVVHFLDFCGKYFQGLIYVSFHLKETLAFAPWYNLQNKQ